MFLLRFVVVALLVLGLSAAARAAQTEADNLEQTLSPYFVVPGGDPTVDALPLKSTKVDARIAGVIAAVTVTQVYRNEGTRPIEARYVFPASTRAAVYALRLRVGERVVDAEIREKQQARRDFEQAKHEGKSASLLEQHRPNVFQMSIANVMPGDEIAVDLRYTETIVPTDGNYQFVFPTVVGPRYNGGIRADGLPSESQKNDTWIAQPTLRKGEDAPQTFAFNAVVTAPLAIRSLTSPSHAIQVTGLGEKQATISLAADRAHADRDVVIDYRLASDKIDAGVIVYEGRDESFFLAMIEPPARVSSTAILPREYVFVVDVSGSMHGFPLNTAKALLRDLIGGLRPSDTFNVIPFAGGHSLLAPQSLAASEANIARAIRFINGQKGGGGTELLPALRTALAMPADVNRARSFIIVTDGYVSIEKEAFDLVRTKANEANVFAFGIGSSVNRFLIDGLARAGQGEPFYVLHPGQAPEVAARLRTFVEAPVLSRVKVNFRGFDAYDLAAPSVPDLFGQRPLAILGKFRGPARGTIEVDGYTADGPVRMALDVDRGIAVKPSDTQALRYLWARERIAQLSDDVKLGASDDTVKEITRLGLAYNLLTDYTSFIAIDKVVRNRSGDSTTVDQPQPLPQGVEETALAAVPSTPEPEFFALAAVAGVLAWWARRRRGVAVKAQRSHG
jgi:Ca-activated chloride channel family protein